MKDKRGCPPDYNSGFCADYGLDCDDCWEEWEECARIGAGLVCGVCAYCVPVQGTAFHTCVNRQSPFEGHIVAILSDACGKYRRNVFCQTCEKRENGCMKEACIHPLSSVTVKELELIGTKNKKTVVFDFDGVIHSYVHPYTTETDIPDPPVPGISELIDDLNKDFKVVVCSTRCQTSTGKRAVEEWLYKHGIAVYDVVSDKPPAVCYVDDRAIRFDGKTDGLAEQIRTFKSWRDK